MLIWYATPLAFLLFQTPCWQPHSTALFNQPIWRDRSIWRDYTIAFDHSFVTDRHLNLGAVVKIYLVITVLTLMVSKPLVSRTLELEQISIMSPSQWASCDPWRYRNFTNQGQRKIDEYGVFKGQPGILRDPFDIPLFQFQPQLTNARLWLQCSQLKTKKKPRVCLPTLVHLVWYLAVWFVEGCVGYR